MKLDKIDPATESDTFQEADLKKILTHLDDKFAHMESNLNSSIKDNYNKIRDESKKTSTKTKTKDK